MEENIAKFNEVKGVLEEICERLGIENEGLAAVKEEIDAQWVFSNIYCECDALGASCVATCECHLSDFAIFVDIVIISPIYSSLIAQKL